MTEKTDDKKTEGAHTEVRRQDEPHEKAKPAKPGDKAAAENNNNNNDPLDDLFNDMPV